MEKWYSNFIIKSYVVQSIRIPLDRVEFCQVRRDPNYTISLLSNGMTSCQFRKMFSALIIDIIFQPMGLLGLFMPVSTTGLPD